MDESARLGRSELTAAQRSSAIRRRKEIWEALHPNETGGTSWPTCLSDGRKAGPQHDEAFAADTSKVSGQSKRDINRHLARAEALGDDLDEVVGTSLDKGVELDALAKMPEPQRRADKLREGIELQRWLWQRAYAMERNNRVLCGACRRRDGQPGPAKP